MSVPEHCPNCPDQGWYAEMQFVSYDDEGNAIGEPVQIQCEFCYTNPNSIFYRKNNLND